ncbi:MAG: NUDIX hydrolase [Elusimicrobia bacterium]|nr:NUDIX hydrolase [Elusimicrobiota bacterium]
MCYHSNVPKSFVETAVRRRPVHHGRAISFYVDTVRLPDGRPATREYVDHPGAVAVVPFVDPRTVVLVRQYRYPVAETTWEIPAGKLDARESPLSCVRRELREETGYAAGRIRRLASFWPAPAFSNELLHIYVAGRLRPGTMQLDEDEFLAARKVPFETALAWVRSGRIRDAKTMIGLMACALEGRGRGGVRRRAGRG